MFRVDSSSDLLDPFERAMGRELKDERGRSESSLRRKAATLAFVILVLALIVGSLFGDRGLLQLMRQRQQTEALARELSELQAENARLATEIRALMRKDPRVI